MAIQNRRGLKKDFDPAKMLPGEFAVSIDSETENQIVWMCFAPGVVKRIGTYEDFQKYLDENCKTAYEYAVDGGYAGTEDEFKAKMAQECADAIVASASGAVIAVSDSAEQRLKRLLLHGKSTQDGTPTPSAPIEIVNAGKYNEATGKYDVDVIVTGRNRFDKSTITPHAYIQDLDGSLNIMTDSSNTLYNYRNASDFVNIAGLTKIYVSPNQEQSALGAFYDADKNYISGMTTWGMAKDVPKGACYARFTVASTVLDTFMVTDGTSLLPYEPYRPVQTVTIALSDKFRSTPDGMGDIIHVDQAEKSAWVERKTIKIVFDGSSDENWAQIGTNTSGKKRFSELDFEGIVKGYVSSAKANIFCNQFIAKSVDECYRTMESVSVRVGGYFYIYEEAYAEKTLDEFKARLSENPITIIAELATPTIEELPEEAVNQLLALTAYYPNTTITTDQGVTMEVDYVADTKNYIDNKFAELQAALLATGVNV